MKIPNPNNPIFVQSNNGERDPNANIAGSWNCDFSRKPGKVFPAIPLEVQVSSYVDETTLGPILAMASFDTSFVGGGPYWGVSSGGDIWKGSASGSWNDDTYTNTPTTTEASDIVSFNGGLYASEDTTNNVAELTTNVWDADWYTTRSGASSLTGGPYPMEVLRIGSPVLAIGSGNKVHTVNSSGTATHNKLTLDAEMDITWIRSGTSKAYIGGIMSKQSSRVVVYEWDGGDTVPTRQYQLETRGVLSAIVLDDVLYILTYEMEIKRLSGGGFVTVAQFPITKERGEVFNYDGGGYVDTVAVPRGMAVLNDKILINISSLIEADTVLNEKYIRYYPSGVWEFNPATGSLTHKHAYTITDTRTGDIGQWSSPVGSGIHPGALMPVMDLEGDTTLVVSGSFYRDKGTTSGDYTAIYGDRDRGTTKRVARLWTNQIFTTDTSAFFEKIALKYGKMGSASDSIVIKYRTSEDVNYPILAEVTWTDANTFTTTNSLTNAKVGDEVFVLCGFGGGSSSHITSLSENAGTWTVNIDEDAYGVSASDTSSVVIEDWKKLTSFNDQVTTYKEFTLPTPASTWVQFLVELRSAGGDSPVLEEIDIIPTKQQ